MLDKQIQETYAQASSATNKTTLYDPYVKAIFCALAQFREHYRDEKITKWDLFHYIYALLHHPTYRERYQANLKRDLPHIPLASAF